VVLLIATQSLKGGGTNYWTARNPPPSREENISQEVLKAVPKSGLSKVKKANNGHHLIGFII
jgi:hypothetical protein